MIVLAGAWEGSTNKAGGPEIVIDKSAAYIYGYFQHLGRPIICGNNIKFDMHYIHGKMAMDEFYQWLMECPIWDTSIAHYILLGMNPKFPSLEEVCEYWLPGFLTKKGDLIERLLADGKDTTDADPGELREYLRSDVFLTWHVAIAQMEKAKEMGLLRLILTHGTALKAIPQMEYTGIKFDLEGCHHAIVKTTTKLKELNEALLL